MFGRAEEKFPLGLDLTPDVKVSRLHGRIWFENDAWCMEDGNSSRGRRLKDVEIKERGKEQLRVDEIIEVGDSKLEIESLEPASFAQASFLEVGTALVAHEGSSGLEVAISQVVDATDFGVAPLAAEGETARRLKMICDLPIQFCTKTDLGTLLPAIVDRLAELIPKGASWAVVLRGLEAHVLLLKAHNVIREPKLSETLPRRAMTDHKAFIWEKHIEANLSMSIVQNQIDVGMYAPLLWQDKALGVICGGGLQAGTSFT